MVAPNGTAADWTPTQRLTFRFACAYFILYIFPFPLAFVPVAAPLIRPYNRMWNALVPWVGKHVLHLPHDITVLPPEGTGDSMFHYIRLVCIVGLALAVAFTWTVADRRRGHYTRLSVWLRVYVRGMLGVTLIGYGAFKVIKSQFQFPGLESLVEPLGNSSPMGLLWKFMGYSLPYNVFTGCSEMLGGLLLFSRRLTTLGALVSIAVLSNVVMLNLSYDVGVKLSSLNLLAMAVFLLAPEVRRLTDVFVFNRPTIPAPSQPLFAARWMNRIGSSLAILFLVYVLFARLQDSWDLRTQYGDLSPRSPLDGIYDVESFARNGDAAPPLLTDTTRWRRVIFAGAATISFMNDTVRRYRFTPHLERQTVELVRIIDHDLALREVAPDMEQRTWQLSSRLDPPTKIVLECVRPDHEHLVLRGLFGDDSIRVSLRRLDASTFLLVNHPFHWVKEFPLNR